MLDHAALYIADPSLLGSRVLDTFPSIVKYESISSGEDATGLKVFLEGVTITMNFMPADERAEHLLGLRGWLQEVLKDQDQLRYALARLQHVVLPVGCVIEPGFDDDGIVEGFLFSLNDRLNGLLFFANTVFDYDGKPVAGYHHDLKQKRST